jgi:hypothetical protein
MITLESGGMLHSKKIVYFISKMSIPQNERKQTGPNGTSEPYLFSPFTSFCMVSSVTN